MRYSRQKMTICTSLPEIGWQAGVGASRGVDPREMAKSDLIVVWGGNPVSTQVNVMTHVSRGAEGARREAGGDRSVPDADRRRRRPASGAAARNRCRAGLRGDACRVPRRLCRSRLHARLHRLPRRAGGASARPRSRMGGRQSPACRSRRSRPSPRCMAAPSAATSAPATVSPAAATACAAMHAVTCLPAVTGAWQHEGGGALWSNRGMYHWNKTLIEGLDARRSVDPRAGHEPDRQRADRRPRPNLATGRRSMRC